MHIPDALLDTKTVAAGWAVSLPVVGWAVRTVRRRASEGRIVLMAVLAALIFALQMLNFYVAGGTTGHFAGGALAAILLGPGPAVVVITAVLVVQAFVFADGGITALGANVLTMAIVAPSVGWWVYSAAVRVRPGRAGRAVGAFAGGWTAAVAAALGAAVMIWTSGRAPLLAVAGSMAAWHAAIGIGEGLVTAGLVSYVFAVRPDLMRSDSDVMRPRRLAASLAVFAAAAAGLSIWAARRPDALQRVIGGYGFSEPATRFTGMLPDYVVPGVANATLAGVLAAVVGAALAGSMLYAVALSVRRSRPAAPAHSTAGIHRHVHEHEGELHAHPHHHAEDAEPPHEHRHPRGFERLTYLVSPVHSLDPRAKIVAGLVLILAVVLSPPARPLEIGLLVALLLAVAALGRLPLGTVLARTSVVLPFAGVIALLAPLTARGGSPSMAGIAGAYSAGGWVIAWAIVSKAFVAVLVSVVLSATTPVPRLIRGLEALRAPDVFVTLFTFLQRYVSVLRQQTRSLTVALDSRAPSLTAGRRLLLYGNLAGNMVVRSYERGERVHAAMLSRGFTGSLPTAEVLRFRPADALVLVLAILAALAVVLY